MLQCRSQNLKEVPQDFTEVFNVDGVIRINQHYKEKQTNLSSIFITDVKLASHLKKGLEFCFSFPWQEHLHSKISGTWLCVYVSITVLLWQKVHGALSANIYLFKVWIVTLEKCEICSRLTLSRMDIFGAAHRWGAKKALTP